MTTRVEQAEPVAVSKGSDWYCEEALLLRAVQVSGWSPPIEPSIPGFADWQELRRGGQGVVFSATQLSTRRRVAVKILMGGPVASRAQLRRFEREIDLIAGFQHPHIVRLYDRGVTAQGLPYYVMELIDGCSLDEYLGLHPPGGAELAVKATGGVAHRALPASPVLPPVKDALSLLAEVCEAVAYAHERGVVHRDLKPGNILVDQAGKPHVLDFGLGRAMLGSGARSSAALSHTGDFMGTLPWASPEQVEGVPDRVDARGDVYSLGLILYQALTGRHPYPVGSLREALDGIRSVDPQRPTSLRKELDAALDVLVLKCLAKEPALRYRDAAELAGDIRNYLSGRPLRARGESFIGRLRRRARRTQPALLFGALLLCGVGASGLVWALRAFGPVGDQAAAPAGAGSSWNTVRLRDGPTVILDSFAGLGNRISVPTNLAVGHETPASVTLQSGQSLEVGGYFTVGNGTRARLDVKDGAAVRCWNARVADLDQGDGVVTIRGRGTRWVVQERQSFDGWFLVGGDGTGEFRILDGAAVEDCRGHIAWNGTGRAIVDGVGSTWTHRFFFEVGRFGHAELAVRNGGQLFNLEAWIGRAPESEGGVLIAGTGSQWINRGSLYVGGYPERPGGLARLAVEDGGTVVVCHALRVWGPGTVALNGGWLAASVIDHRRGGRFEFVSGALETETFEGDLANAEGTLVCGPRARATTITGDYSQAGGALQLTFRGADAPEMPRLRVGGTATLGGRLILDATTDFQPSPNEEHVILEAAFVEGEFEHPAGRIDFAGGGSCEIIYTPTQVVLTHFRDPLPGRDDAPQSPLCDSCPAFAPDGPFPARLAANTTGDSDFTFVGPPDNVGFPLGDRTVVYDFGGPRVLDGDGADFCIYEWYFGGLRHRDIDVLVSQDGVNFVSAKSTEGPGMRIAGDEAHAAPGQVRSYDLAVTGFGAVRYIRIDGLIDAATGLEGRFHLDAVGAIHCAPADAADRPQ